MAESAPRDQNRVATLIGVDSSDLTTPEVVAVDSATNRLLVNATITGTLTITATDLDIRNLTATDVVTAELSAIDNAVLDAIDAVLDTIKIYTETI